MGDFTLGCKSTVVTTEERFWSKVDRSGDCWIWTAGVAGPPGCKHGVFTIGSRTDGSRGHIYAHRWSYIQANGPVDDALQIHHLCGEPLLRQAKPSESHVRQGSPVGT